ncbi:MAG: hypothetical protein UV82_C0008G0072, partial [Candidatus Magasanikbacteria bacterium GW2011_GWD2_43_18]
IFTAEIISIALVIFFVFVTDLMRRLIILAFTAIYVVSMLKYY